MIVLEDDFVSYKDSLRELVEHIYIARKAIMLKDIDVESKILEQEKVLMSAAELVGINDIPTLDDIRNSL